MWWVRYRYGCRLVWSLAERDSRGTDNGGAGLRDSQSKPGDSPLGQIGEQLHHWAPDNVADERITAVGPPVAVANRCSDDFPSRGRRGASGLGQEGVERKKCQA